MQDLIFGCEADAGMVLSIDLSKNCPMDCLQETARRDMFCLETVILLETSTRPTS